jgi:hypothetical protein
MTTRILINNLNHRINELQAQVTTNNEDALHNPSPDVLVMENVGISGISSLSGYQTNDISLLSNIDLDNKQITRINKISNDANLNIQTAVELGYIDLKTNISQEGAGKSAEVVIYNDSVAIGTYNEPSFGGYKSMTLDIDNNLTFSGGYQNIYNPLGDIHSKSLILTQGGLGGISFSDGSIQTTAGGAGGGGNMNNPSLVDLDMSNHDILNVTNLNHPSLINLTTNVENSVIDIYTNKSALSGSATEIFMDNTHIYIGSYDTPSSSAKYLQLDLDNDLTFTGGNQNIINTLGTLNSKSIVLTNGAGGDITFSDGTVQSSKAGKIDSVVEGSYIGVDITDPINPVVNLSLPNCDLTNKGLISSDTGVLSWTTLGVSHNTFYCNSNSEDLSAVLTQVGAQQGCQIIMSSGSFTGSTITLSNDNLAIIGPRCSPAICELIRAVVVNGSRIRISNIQIDGESTLTGNACRYSNCDFMDNVIIGSFSNTRYITVENCEFTTGKTLSINATYNQEPIFFVNCNFGGCTINLNSSSPLQIVFNNCSNFIGLPLLTKATLVGLNVVIVSNLPTIYNTMNKVILGIDKGTAGQVLTSGGSGDDTWTTVGGGGNMNNPSTDNLDMADFYISNVSVLGGIGGIVGLNLYSSEIGLTSNSTIQLNDVSANIEWNNLLTGDLEVGTIISLDNNGFVITTLNLNTTYKTWTFGNDGTLSFPNGSSQEVAYTGQFIDTATGNLLMEEYNIQNVTTIAGSYATGLTLLNTTPLDKSTIVLDINGIFAQWDNKELDNSRIGTTLIMDQDGFNVNCQKLTSGVQNMGFIIDNGNMKLRFNDASLQSTAYTGQFIGTATGNLLMEQNNIENVNTISGTDVSGLIIGNNGSISNSLVQLDNNNVVLQWNNDALGSLRINTSLTMDQDGFVVNCQKLTSGNQNMGFVIDNNVMKLRFSDGTLQTTASTGGGGGVTSITEGTYINVDSTIPSSPVVSLNVPLPDVDGKVLSSSNAGYLSWIAPSQSGFINPAVENLNMNTYDITGINNLGITGQFADFNRLLTCTDYLGIDTMTVDRQAVRIMNNQFVMIPDLPLISKNGYSKRDDNFTGDTYTICGNYSPVIIKSLSSQLGTPYPVARNSIAGWNTVIWNDQSTNNHQINTEIINSGTQIRITNTNFLKITWSSTVFHGDNNQTRLVIDNTNENIYGTTNNNGTIINTTSTGMWIGKIASGETITLQHYTSRVTTYGMGGNDYIPDIFNLIYNVNANIVIEDAGGYKDQF